MVKIIRRLK